MFRAGNVEPAHGADLADERAGHDSDEPGTGGHLDAADDTGPAARDGPARLVR